MQVVNVKVAFIRPKYKNFKEWMNDPENLYIGRQGRIFIDGQIFHYKQSPWHNPYKVEKDGTLDEILGKYSVYISKKIEKGELKLSDLHGKRLGCWCKPSGCHGDVLLKLLSE
jgi:hypothetical protein